MNKLDKYYLIVAGLLSLGIPFFFMALQIPKALTASMLSQAAEYVILDEPDYDFWAQIPGRTGIDDKKEYYIYNCTNAEEVALKGATPKFTEEGPFIYSYIHDLKDRSYNRDKPKDSRVSFIKHFEHVFKEDGSKDLKQDYRVINFAGMKRWSNIRSKPRFKLAIEGFYETFTYSKNNFVRDLLMKDLINFYKITNNIYHLTDGIKDVSKEVAVNLAEDRNYGLIQNFNVYEWTQMCNTLNPRIEHEIYNYFGFSFDSFVEVKTRFCDDFYKRYNKTYESLCNKIGGLRSDCSNYNISYYQWMHGNLVDKGTYVNVTYKTLFGIYEFFLFRKKFLEMLRPIYVEQFKNLDWTKNRYFLLDTHYEYPDFKTDEASLLLYENMEMLYNAGKGINNPFKFGPFGPVDEPLDLRPFDKISRILKVSNEHAFVLYSYFEYFVNNTVILKSLGGDLEKERIGHYGSVILKDISDYCLDFLDVLIYTRALSNKHKGFNCERAARHYFSMNDTSSIIDNLIEVICNNKEFNTDVSKAVGLKFFVEASSNPFASAYQRLFHHLKASVPSFSESIFQAMIFGNSSFANELKEIKKKVKEHYNKINPVICNNKFSPYCTKKQFFFAQFRNSFITKNPYPDSDLKPSDHIGDWWIFILEYIDYQVSDFPSYVPVLPDKPIEVPMEIPYLERYYSRSNIEYNDLYDCFNSIKLFDTDVFYSILLNASQSSKPPTCQKFGSSFFYNTTRYFIKNIQFGPMFSRLRPEEVYFGHLDRWLVVEHELVDYLDGDDCTVDPWIGFIPKNTDQSKRIDAWDYLTWDHVMYTGLDDNANIRKYIEYHRNRTIFYRKLVQDKSGDKCNPESHNPFRTPLHSDIGTDGFQFAQYGRSGKIWDSKIVMDPTSLRPLKIIRKNAESENYYDLQGDYFVQDFMNDYLCPDGVSINRGIDMTSFYQHPAVITAARYVNISEIGYHLPQVEYKRPIEKDYTPTDVHWSESFYMIEPYTGIALMTVRKLMVSLVLNYDELYESSIKEGNGEFIPYFALYENATVSKKFVDLILDGVLSSMNLRETLTIVFAVFGIVFILGGLAMIIRGFFYQAHEVGLDFSDELRKQQKVVTTPQNEASLPLLSENELSLDNRQKINSEEESELNLPQEESKFQQNQLMEMEDEVKKEQADDFILGISQPELEEI